MYRTAILLSPHMSMDWNPYQGNIYLIDYVIRNALILD